MMVNERRDRRRKRTGCALNPLARQDTIIIVQSTHQFCSSDVIAFQLCVIRSAVCSSFISRRLPVLPSQGTKTHRKLGYPGACSSLVVFEDTPQKFVHAELVQKNKNYSALCTCGASSKLPAVQLS